MTELPIVVETVPWLTLTLGGALIFSSFYVARRTIAVAQTDGMNIPNAILAVVFTLFMLGLGTSLAVQYLNWQFRIDEKGIALRAPFDYTQPGGEIAWSDLTSLWVSASIYRGKTFRLHLHGKDGTEIIVAAASHLPAQLGPLLQKLVTERAPQAKGGWEIAGELEAARAYREQDFSFANGYWLRNGRGELLR